MGAPAARAACHSFTVQANPSSVAEGGAVTVTVSRDAVVNPSQVDVATIDESAKAGQDYTELRRTVSFTAEASQQFTIPIADDTLAEGAETFRVRLSNPGGCAVNPNFRVGPDAQVTIQASDATPLAAPVTPTPRPVATPRGTAASTTTASTPSATPTPSPPDSTPPTTASAEAQIPSPLVAAPQREDRGFPVAAAAVAAVAAAGALGAVLWWARRRAA